MKYLVSALIFLLGFTFRDFAQQNEVKPLGINLEGYKYAFPVKYYRLHSQGQVLGMGYMYEQAPDPNRHTVLLLHGKNFNGAYWGPTMKALLKNGYDVLVPDQVGFGKSTKPNYYHYTFQQLAHNTKSIIDSIGIKSVIVLGHSMGGMLATRFTLMYPEMTEQLILEDPIGLEDWKIWVPYPGIDAWYQQELKKNYQGIKKYMRTSYFGGDWKKAYGKLVYPLAAVTKSPEYPRFAWNSALTYDMIFTQPVCYEFKNIKVPTVLIIGQEDRTALGKNLVSEEIASRMGDYPKLGKETASKIPGAKLIELDDIGHIPHIENFDLFLNKLLPVLKR